MQLNELIRSQKGDKFRKFAQGLTLDNLVWLANNQLTRLHGRYSLHRKAGDALKLEVVDTWQGDTVRDTRTLDTALDALDALNASGKTIGVISHVDAMKERIPVQINVYKKNGLGLSRLARRFAVN